MAEPSVFGFTKGTAVRLRNMLREQGQEGGGASRRPENRRVAIALTPVNGIPARSGTTVGAASCTFYEISGSNQLTATSVTESVYNLSGIAVAGATYIVCNREYISGKWVVVMESCEP
jgi:hypothetical protein